MSLYMFMDIDLAYWTLLYMMKGALNSFKKNFCNLKWIDAMYLIHTKNCHNDDKIHVEKSNNFSFEDYKLSEKEFIVSCGIEKINLPCLSFFILKSK